MANPTTYNYKFSDISNNIPESNPRYQKMLLLSNITGTNSAYNKMRVENLLSNTTLKKVCCMAKQNNKQNLKDGYYEVDIKIPFPPGYETQASDFEKKFNYTTVKVKIPESECSKLQSDYQPDNPNYGYCNDFFNTYCENIKYIYNRAVNNNFDITEFNYYAPECMCHNDIPDGISMGIPHSCYMGYCSENNKSITYLDQLSRTKPCDSAICVELTKVGDIIALQGSTINFTTKVTQTCGKTGVGGSTQQTSQSGVDITGETKQEASSSFSYDVTDKTMSEIKDTKPTVNINKNTNSAVANPFNFSDSGNFLNTLNITNSSTYTNTVDSSGNPVKSETNNNNINIIISIISSSIIVIIIIIIIMMTRKSSKSSKSSKSAKKNSKK